MALRLPARKPEEESPEWRLLETSNAKKLSSKMIRILLEDRFFALLSSRRSGDSSVGVRAGSLSVRQHANDKILKALASKRQKHQN